MKQLSFFPIVFQLVYGLLFAVTHVGANPKPCNGLTGDEYVFLPSFGCVKGTDTSALGYRSFRGIPFASAPTLENDLRFKKPRAHPGWQQDQYLDATQFGAACMQPVVPNGIPFETSEDCLNLNIWAPVESFGSSNFPVMIFFHGGGYSIGRGSELFWDASQLVVATNVIVVTINYRLGAFGFFYSDTYGMEGNYGYYDQLFAIRWVYDNIEHFGGSKDDIIVFGQSAGGQSAANVLLNYGAPSQMIEDSEFAVFDKVKGAILQSPVMGAPGRTPNTWGDITDQLVELAGCGAASNIGECLRLQVSSEDLLAAQLAAEVAVSNEPFEVQASSWGPTFLTDILPQKSALDGFETGQFNTQASVIIGNTQDEGLISVDGIFNTLNIDAATYSYDEYRDILQRLFDRNSDGSNRVQSIVDQIEDVYTPDDLTPETLFQATDEILNQIRYQCPARYAARKMSEFVAGNNVYMYHFDYFSPLVQGLGVLATPSCSMLGAVCHFVEVPLIFFAPVLQSLQFLGIFVTPPDGQMAQILQGYWTNLAKLGEPGSVGDVEWTPYLDAELVGSDTSTMVFFDDAQQAAYEVRLNGFEEFNCDFWDQFGYYWLNSEVDCPQPTIQPTEEA